jgi:predicted kinase
MKNILLCLVGLPRSGKSTWAGDMAYRNEFYPIVNKDSIRLALHGRAYDESREDEVRQMARVMVTALFIAGHTLVCLDETNITYIHRARWLSRSWDVRLKVFDTPMEECIRRAKKKAETDIIPVIEKMAVLYEPLTEEEQTRIWKGRI